MTDLAERTVNLRTHPLAVEGAKKPWDGITLTGPMQGKYLFRAALARNVLPFALVNPPLIVLPLVQADDVDSKGQPLPGKLHWQLLDAPELTARGDLETARWFGQCERLWDERRSVSAKKQNMSAYNRLNFQRGLTDQPIDAQWAVIFNRSAKDGNACVVNVQSFQQRLIVDFAMYASFMSTEDEARYLECYLNSGYVNRAIKAFQTSGNFGERDVTKKILEFPWPEFSPNLPSHRRLVALGRQAAQAVQGILGVQQDLELDPRTLGRLRTRIRSELKALMAQIDTLVEAISTGQDLLALEAYKDEFLTRPRPVVAGLPAQEISDFLRSEREGWSRRDVVLHLPAEGDLQ
ncbi:MAG: hypothetical protein PHO55_14330 [Thiomonas arsenitoxydans]|nr:hypothetical protein [Thiomonas arsenitoxydans]